MSQTKTLTLGIIGLGRMGAGIARRLMRAGHHTVVFDVNSKTVGELAKDGAHGAKSIDDMLGALGPSPRAIWVMLPSGKITEQTIEHLGHDPGQGRHHHRWRQYLLQGRYPPRQGVARKRASATSMSARPAAFGAWSAAIA